MAELNKEGREHMLQTAKDCFTMWQDSGYASDEAMMWRFLLRWASGEHTLV